MSGHKISKDSKSLCKMDYFVLKYLVDSWVKLKGLESYRICSVTTVELN